MPLVSTDRSVSALWRDLWPYLRPYRLRLIVGLSIGLVSVIIAVVAPYFLRRAINTIQQGGHEYILDAVWIVLLAALSGVLSYVQRQLATGATREFEYDLRRDLFHKLLTLDAYYYSRTRVGDLMNRLNTDLSAVRLSLGQGVSMGWRVGLTIILAAGAMFLTNFWLAAAVVLTLMPIFFIMRYLLGVIDRRWREAQEVFDHISTRAQEGFSGIRVIRGFAAEDREIGAFRALNQSYITKSLSLAKVKAPLGAFMFLLMGLAQLVVLGYGGYMVIGGGMSLGALVQFNAYLGMLGFPIIGLGMLLSSFRQGQTSWFRVKEIFEAEPVIQEPQEILQPPDLELSGEVRFEDVWLELGGRQILKGLTLSIPEGATLGITGRTGSGKTLLISLIPRMLDPGRGRVLLGGRDVRRLPIATVRGLVGMVPQEPFLFSEHIAENIDFASAEVDRERVSWAATLADLDRDIEAFPDGYHTMLGERGVTLSGGQRQRTALARALAMRPKVLILDEAMSAVDTETEDRILRGLRSQLGKQTTILVAHRTSTLRHADWIIVLGHGEIVEEGTHEMLIGAGGYYAELERIQKLSAEVD